MSQIPAEWLTETILTYPRPRRKDAGRSTRLASPVLYPGTGGTALFLEALLHIIQSFWLRLSFFFVPFGIFVAAPNFPLSTLLTWPGSESWTSPDASRYALPHSCRKQNYTTLVLSPHLAAKMSSFSFKLVNIC